MVAQLIERGVAKLVGIECGADGEGQNLPCVHVLYDDRAVEGLRLLHCVIESALGHELNVLVDGENEVAAWLRLVLG